MPPILNIDVEYCVNISGGLFYCFPCLAGEPGQEQGDEGSAILEGHEKFFDLHEVRLVVRKVVTSGKTGGHGENELKRTNLASIPKHKLQNDSHCRHR